MKKVILGIGVFTLMASCGTTAEDVNVADMKDACDCSSGFVTIANDILDEIGDKTENEMKEDEELKKKMEPKFEKLDELEDKCRKELKVTMDEMKACDEGLEDVMKKFEEKF